MISSPVTPPSLPDLTTHWPGLLCFLLGNLLHLDGNCEVSEEVQIYIIGIILLRFKISNFFIMELWRNIIISSLPKSLPFSTKKIFFLSKLLKYEIVYLPKVKWVIEISSRISPNCSALRVSSVLTLWDTISLWVISSPASNSATTAFNT